MAGQKLGQHFLHDRNILEQIARAACPSPEPLVIEIGPGRGALTEFLQARAERTVAIELDAGLAAQLRARFPRVEVVQGDVLDTGLGQWGPAVVAGNLPYYITSPILERVCALGPMLRRAVLLMQREVAERLVAAPGRRDYGFLTVATQLFTTPELLFRVPPGAFSPPPKVDSAAVRLTPHPPQVADTKGFLEFAGRCFQHKRKTLRNNLLPFYGRAVEAWPEAALRAEQLSPDDLARLFLDRRQSP
ncbi:MAG TPA: 16S rRNA (adenine(1518)-N(6)/adenine(1519)-N(6))-dimethyltransferase RsmA [Bryobacteraceae bacterium]|nr:16S rRNA (adenine(1518)-N(6)/adenine(1519)-N(6))-dimethyltransferase RsmA [Bryobacteraceae bacterium]